MISRVEVNINKPSCENKALLGHIVHPPEDYEAIDVAVGCDVRYALAVEETPYGIILIMGRSGESDTWLNPRKRARLPMARSCSG